MIPLAPFLDILECPVCLETIRVPFKECQRGHLICNGCAEPLPSCPSCKSAFFLDNPVCMKKLIEALPRMCQFYGSGCREIIEPQNNHESFCGHRPVLCRRCLGSQPASQLKHHLEVDHAQNPLRKNMYSRILLKEFRGKIAGEYYDSSLFVMDTFFWLRITINYEKEIEIKFNGVHIKKPTDDYFIILKFEQDNVGTRVTLKASEDPQIACGEEEEICSTKIRQKTFSRCIDDQGNLVIEYEVSAKPKIV